MADTHPPSGVIEIWFDGNCPLCRGSRTWCVSRDSNNRLIFKDIRTTDNKKLPVPRGEAESAMWVRDADGGLVCGFEGWRRILTVLPRWRWLAVVTGQQPLRWIGPKVYSLVARWRFLLS